MSGFTPAHRHRRPRRETGAKFDLRVVSSMLRAGRSQREIAGALGVTAPAIGYWMKKRGLRRCCPHCGEPLPINLARGF